MTVATLTLGQSTYVLSPKDFPVQAEGKNYKWEVEPKKGDSIQDLAVKTFGGGSHSIKFESRLVNSTVDTRTDAKFVDGSDKIDFEAGVAGTTILTGYEASTGGDTVCFFKGVNNSSLTTGSKSDSVSLLRTKATVGNATFNLGKGQDAITVAGKDKLGTGVVINLGKDSDRDLITVADKSVFNKTTVVNFTDKVDRIKVGNTTYTNKADLKKVFGSDIIFTDT